MLKIKADQKSYTTEKLNKKKKIHKQKIWPVWIEKLNDKTLAQDNYTFTP